MFEVGATEGGATRERGRGCVGRVGALRRRGRGWKSRAMRRRDRGCVGTKGRGKGCGR